MALNLNAWYGSKISNKIAGKTAGKTFYVTSSTGANWPTLQQLFTPDDTWVNQVRVWSSITLALAECVTGRGDVILVAPDYTTAPTDTELGSAGTKWVRIEYINQPEWVYQVAATANLALPATTTGTLFTVTGLCELIAIVWVVTTVIQSQTCNFKISTVSNSTTTDICTNLNINGNLAQSRYSITGTFADAMINTNRWVPVARQATAIIIQEGTIIATTSATNTGNIRWVALYRPLSPWARIY